MGINKVVVNGENSLDLSNDTVSASDVASGVTFHDKTGAALTGNAQLPSNVVSAIKYSDPKQQRVDVTLAEYEISNGDFLNENLGDVYWVPIKSASYLICIPAGTLTRPLEIMLT